MEKIAETVKCKQSIGGNLMETKSDDGEKQRKYGKTADLNRFATNGIDCCDRDPIARDEAGGRKDQIPDTSVVQSDVSTTCGFGASYFLYTVLPPA